MPTHTTIHEEIVLDAFHAFWKIWAQRKHEACLEELLAFWDSEATFFGTGADEIRLGIDEIAQQLLLDDLLLTYPLDIMFSWIRVSAFEAMAVVVTEVLFKAHIDGDLQSFGPMRLSQAFRKEGDRWLIVHLHASFASFEEEPGSDLDEWRTPIQKLERQVVERTNELRQALFELKTTQQQLIHAEKMASLGQLTAGIAHEIKNPLNFVNNFAEVNEELTQELREALVNGEDVEDLLADLEQNAQVIAQHGKRADSIVHAMMQHASGSKGQREPTDLNALVSEHIDLAYHGKRAQVTGFESTIERDLGAVGSVELVPQEIGRVLLNLLSNAFDAVHEHAVKAGGEYIPTVSVSTRQVDGQVEIRVSDNGPGIPGEIKDRIFEPFFTTKPTGTGTGLGLSLSYDIVRQGHGGTLTLGGEEGEGATFIVKLPMNPKEADSSA